MNPRAKSGTVDWNAGFGYAAYAASFGLLFLIPHILHYDWPFLRDVWPPFVTVVSLPIMGLVLGLPFMGAIAFISWDDAYRALRVALATFGLAAVIAYARESGFEQAQWAYLDLILVAHLATVGSKCPETAPLGWAMFAFLLVCIFAREQVDLWRAFNWCAIAYMALIGALVSLGKLTLSQSGYRPWQRSGGSEPG